MVMYEGAAAHDFVCGNKRCGTSKNLLFSFLPLPTCSQTYMPILLNLHVIVSAVRLYSLTKSFIYRIKRSS